MQRRMFVAALVGLSLPSFSISSGNEPRAQARDQPISVAPTDWPWWRGPTRNGIAAPDQKPPRKWSRSENVLWKAPVPGRGHGSPTVVGKHIYLAAAEPDREVQSVLCYDRLRGKLLWQTEVHRGGFETKGNTKASLASCTVACDGARVFVNFLHAGAVYTSALSCEGRLLWQTKISDYVIHQGYGSSPALYQSLVIVSADNKAGGAVAALDRMTGMIVWKRGRPRSPNYASPIVLHAAGRDQLFLTGCDRVTSLDPLTGEKLWEFAGATTECVTSTVTDGQVIITSGGFPRNHVEAVRADGSGKVVWTHNTRVYVPSMVVLDGYLYAVLDGGVAVCWSCATGKEVWRGRLAGTFSASLVLAGTTLFATNERGQTYLFQATPEGFHQLGENKLGDEVLATPAICDSRIYLRVAQQTAGRRQEMLYCVGHSEDASSLSGNGSDRAGK